MAIDEGILNRIREELTDDLPEDQPEGLVNQAQAIGRFAELSCEAAFEAMLDESKEELESTLEDMKEQIEPGPGQRMDAEMIGFGRDLISTIESVLDNKFHNNDLGM